MFKFNKKLIISFFIIGLLCANSAFAQYSVIKAKTVPNNNEAQTNSATKSGENDIEDTFIEDEYYSSKNNFEDKTNDFFSKFKKKKQAENTDIKEETPFDDENGSVQNSNVSTKNYENVTVDDKNKFKVNADKITYSEEDGNIYAKGNVEIISVGNNTTLKSDTAILERGAQTLKLYDNVKILKDNSVMTGEYLLVDFNEENILIENPKLDAYSFEITAQEGYLQANDIELINGIAKAAPNKEYAIESRAFQRYENVAMDYVRQKVDRSANGNTRQNYLIKAKNIVLTSYKDHNSLILKNSDIYYNNRRINKNATIEFVTDKQREICETGGTIAGSIRGFGTYIGYGFVNKLPKGQTLKLAPALTYGDSNLGVGLVAKYQTRRGLLDAGYSTSTTNLVARGRYRFNDGLELRYGRNAYIPEGFMGARRSGYSAQLQKTKSYYNEDLKIRFYHGVFAGIMSEYEKHNQEEAYATTRFRYMSEIRKNLLTVKNEEQSTSLSVNLLAQGMASVYGSGETTGVARFGPYVTTRFKRWESSVGYLLSGVHGDSPFYFDKYRYGKSTIMLNEKFNFNDYFSLGYRATITPMKDNIEEDLLTESRLYAMFGPQDLKVIFSYDAVRSIAHLDFMFIIGSDNARIEYEKLSTQNIDNGKNKRDFYKSSKRVKIDTTQTL